MNVSNDPCGQALENGNALGSEVAELTSERFSTIHTIQDGSLN